MSKNVLTLGYMGHLDPLGMSPLAMMGMTEQYPWMKEKKSARKPNMQGNSFLKFRVAYLIKKVTTTSEYER